MKTTNNYKAYQDIIDNIFRGYEEQFNSIQDNIDKGFTVVFNILTDTFDRPKVNGDPKEVETTSILLDVLQSS